MPIEHGKRVRSLRDMKIKGTVVGYGAIPWPPRDPDSGPDYGMSPGDLTLHAVYLVKPDNMIGSMNGGPIVLVMRVDMTEAD